MTGGLDFVVFGVARSGTTALEQAINLQPDLFCAHERGLALQALDRDALIDGVLGAPDAGNAVLARSKAALRRKLDADPAVRIGDKLPNYYHSLPKLDRLNPGIAKIVHYRDPVRVALSWDRRARKGRFWDPGKGGIFALFEHAFCLFVACTQTPDARILSSRAVFHDDVALIGRVIAWLSPLGPDRYDHRAFADTIFRSRPLPDLGTEAEPYAASCAALGVPRVDALVDRHGFATVAALADTLVPYSLGVALPCAEFVMASVRRMSPADREAAVAFGRQWLEPHRRLLKVAPGRTDMHAAIEALDAFFLHDA